MPKQQERRNRSQALFLALVFFLAIVDSTTRGDPESPLLWTARSLRNLVQATYMTDDEEENDRVDDMLLHMECRFVVGALVGVCGAWAITDAMMGLSVQIVYSVFTLIAALAWCQVMMWFFAAPARRTIDTPDILMIA